MDNQVYYDESNGRQDEARSTNELNIDDVTVTISTTKKRPTHKKKKRTYLPGLILGLFICLAVLFTILFIFYYIKYDNEDDNGTHDKVCTTADCVKTASMFLESVDLDADPCQDFSQFACGTFYKNTVIPDDQAYAGIDQVISNKNDLTVRLVLQGDAQANEKSYVKKMRQFYKMCLDTDALEKIGQTSLLDSDLRKEWPTLNPDWNSTTFDLSDVTAKYESLFPTPKENLFSYRIDADLLDSTKNVFTITQPELCLGLSLFKDAPRNATAILACQQNYVDVALTLGADVATARQDAKEYMDFEISLAKISVPQVEAANKSRLYNPMTLDEMTKEYPPIDWGLVIPAIFKPAGIHIDSNMTVINKFPSYLAALGALLKSTPDRVLQNRFAFHNAVTKVNDLTETLRKATLQLKKATSGVTTLSPRWKQCVDEVKGVFSAGLSKQFVTKTFSQKSKKDLEKMVHLLMASFRQQVEDTQWMGEETKKAALRKLSTIKYEIGYPDINFDDAYIDNLYINMTITPGKFGQTRSDLRRQTSMAELQKITRKVDNSNWQGLAMEINAQNVNQANAIRFFAGLLQPKFFSETYPSSVNFGAIGSVMGHELTHFFDNKGSQYDEHGNVRNWWHPQDVSRFQKKLQCFIDQYSGFHIKDINGNLNGNLSVGENTADNGGVTAAFRAYKQFSAQNKELPLPGLHLTLEQQFFVAFGQVHCSVHTANDLKFLAFSDEHPPGKYRILGTLKNSVDFAKTFHCPVGSPMNPAKKCRVW